MTSPQQAEMCRISVLGPRGRADLAVPLSVTVASLLPVLLRRMGSPATQGTHPGRWVLQRLGEAPVHPAGTPESLGWRDGDELYLRPVNDRLPELDYDDIADGLAAAVSRHTGRWRPEFNRGLFLGFSIAALLTLAIAVSLVGIHALSTGFAVVVAVVLTAGAIAAGRSEDRGPAALLGLGGCGFAGLASGLGVGGSAGIAELRGGAILAAGVAIAVTALIVLGARATWAHSIPFEPFGVLTTAGGLAALAQWLHLGVGLTAPQTAGLLSVALVATLILAPKIAIRLARIRGPQLPKAAAELQRDIEPHPAKDVTKRTRYADGYLTIVTVSSALVITCGYPSLLDGDYFAAALVALVAIALLLRGRAFLNAWQRVSLSAAGGLGLAAFALALVRAFAPSGQGVLLAVLAVAFGLLLLAMMREPGRRLLPIWGHLANGLETVSAIALIPLLLQLFGVYGSVSGLAG